MGWLIEWPLAWRALCSVVVTPPPPPRPHQTQSSFPLGARRVSSDPIPEFWVVSVMELTLENICSSSSIFITCNSIMQCTSLTAWPAKELYLTPGNWDKEKWVIYFFVNVLHICIKLITPKNDAAHVTCLYSFCNAKGKSQKIYLFLEGP